MRLLLIIISITIQPVRNRLRSLARLHTIRCIYVWHWDQGRLAYFQFDVLRQIAAFVEAHDFKEADRLTLQAAIGLPFLPADYNPWRNYSRILKLSLLVSEVNNRAVATPVAHLLARTGLVTSDEYFHFLVRAFTEPAPALQDWRPNAAFRYPLLFALKYLLTKAAIGANPVASFLEIIGAYRTTGLRGDEDDNQFIRVARGNINNYETAARGAPGNLLRQARESLQVIAQISYLHVRESRMIVSLNRADAHEIFEELGAIVGPRAQERNAEIRRLADLFGDGRTDISFDFPNTVISETVESGFREGSKVKKTHVTIERNAVLRREFFLARPTTICDVCTLDTARTYPWTERVLDLHHLLPLSSGTRVEARGTTFDDLVPVCPSCHRAIHRYYDGWLDDNARDDFIDTEEARGVYAAMRAGFAGAVHV